MSFYRDLLGLEVVQDYVHDPSLIAELTGYRDPDVRAAVLRCSDGSELELAEFRAPSGRGKASRDFCDVGLYSVTLAVSGIDRLVAEMRTAGVRFTNDRISVVKRGHEPPIHVVYCYDPDGVLITLIEVAPAEH